MEILPVVLAGGVGSRLWPLSRAKYPKQFLKVAGEQTMLQETITRMEGLEHIPPFIICNQEHRFLVAEQLCRINSRHSGILLEPIGRNTAPAIALAARFALSREEDALMLVLAADHVIKDTNAFHQSVLAAVPYALKGDMVTFGIKAITPETGYGYIKAGEAAPLDGGAKGFSVDSFIEKPNLEAAKNYVEDGNYLWNSGMFLFKASTYIEELAKFRPDILEKCDSAYNSHFQDLDFIRMSSKLFSQVPDESVDFAVMENTDRAIVVPMDASWNDVGSWSALWEVNSKDSNCNVSIGDVLLEQTKNSYICSNDKLVTTVGVENLIVVETKDAILVADKDKVQGVKSIVDRLKQQSRSECQQHQEIFRPWGSHETVASGERYQVKKIILKPKEKITLQMHHHRAEHWVVVSGTAKVAKGPETFILTENQSTYIPVGIPHSVENPGLIPLELIEVRSGSYFEEDDIIRFDERASELGGDY